MIFLNDNSKFIISGDFNCIHSLWNNNYYTSEGKKLYDWYISNNNNLQIQYSLYPTRMTENNHSYIDLFFISNSLYVKYNSGFSNLLQTEEFESDHRAVFLQIKLKDAIQYKKQIEFPSYNRVNWKNVNRNMNNFLDNNTIPINKKT